MLNKEAADIIKSTMDVQPPMAETYDSTHNGMVLLSPYHGEREMAENKRLAYFVADKLGKIVYLLPRLDPKNSTEAPLRMVLLPHGVFENKSPDFYIGGMLFEGKSMLKIKVSGDCHNAILNRIKDAKEQADNIVLEIPTFVSRKTVSNTILGYLKQSSKDRIIIVKHGNKCYVYKKTRGR